jgi:3-methyladenine DNA glycosylase/8-oxoguanine DNA glycosylase
MTPDLQHSVTIQTGAGFNLAQTAAPVAWGGGRWPNHDWIDQALVTVAQDNSGAIIREIRQVGPTIDVRTNRADVDHQFWAERTLGIHRSPVVSSDPVIGQIAATWPGMRPWSNASLEEAIITAVIGQSVSVQAAAVFERKLCALVNPPVEMYGRAFYAFPTMQQLMDAGPDVIRLCGVTGKRAVAIHQIASIAVSGNLVSELDLAGYDDAGIAALMMLPMVGRWTAESILLWGFGADDAHPTGDVALLRAAKLAYGNPDLNLKSLDVLSEQWRPGRSWAARWLWLNLFGPAPT